MNQNLSVLETIDHPKIKQYLLEEIDICQKHNVEISLENTASIIFFDEPYSGYFLSEPTVELHVAIGKPLLDWLPIFIHESCHRDQWIDNTPEYAALIKGRFNAGDIIDMWIAHAVELNKHQLKEAIDQIIAVELDCEKRSVAKIQKYQLPIDLKEYIQKSNSYILYHLAVAHKRAWSIRNFVFEDPNIWGQMPSTFDQNYQQIDPKLLQVFLDNCW